MRFAMILLTLGACAAEVTDEDAARGCEALQVSNDGCFPDDIIDECVDRWKACNGKVTVMESCPIQFGCDN